MIARPRAGSPALLTNNWNESTYEATGELMSVSPRVVTCSQPSPAEHVGGHLDTRDHDDIGGEDGEGRTNDPPGRGPTYGLGRPVGIQARPAPEEAHEEPEDGRLEGRRDDIGRPEEGQRIAPEQHGRELPGHELGAQGPDEGGRVDHHRQ